MKTKEHPVSIENTKRDALMMEVGYALQKRMCNIEWEVRDSTITCVGKLLQKKSDPVKEWLKRNNLHRRLWESLADSESYVRSSTLQALPVLGSSKELWEDVLNSSRITQVKTEPRSPPSKPKSEDKLPCPKSKSKSKSESRLSEPKSQLELD
eukprot:XP_011680619.1 PREDICTED: uncharacterized protein LOC105446031 [Strongylocentrotus purpuratus]